MCCIPMHASLYVMSMHAVCSAHQNRGGALGPALQDAGQQEGAVSACYHCQHTVLGEKSLGQAGDR